MKGDNNFKITSPFLLMTRITLVGINKLVYIEIGLSSQEASPKKKCHLYTEYNTKAFYK